MNKFVFPEIKTCSSKIILRLSFIWKLQAIIRVNWIIIHQILSKKTWKNVYIDNEFNELKVSFNDIMDWNI
jgi:hypothetical protein